MLLGPILYFCQKTGKVMDDQPGGHVVAVRGEVSIKVPVARLMSASYSTVNNDDLFNSYRQLISKLFLEHDTIAPNPILSAPTGK